MIKLCLPTLQLIRILSAQGVKRASETHRTVSYIERVRYMFIGMPTVDVNFKCQDDSTLPSGSVTFTIGANLARHSLETQPQDPRTPARLHQDKFRRTLTTTSGRTQG
ncbi:hypothetical protein BDN67DRAFT_972742 [Paxillus ammoniavirescens]|nr:hypothetical protein BDN67DRAFT_972742 [Paxillus ammoniavirescens]